MSLAADTGQQNKDSHTHTSNGKEEKNGNGKLKMIIKSILAHAINTKDFTYDKRNVKRRKKFKKGVRMKVNKEENAGRQGEASAGTNKETREWVRSRFAKLLLELAVDHHAKRPQYTSAQQSIAGVICYCTSFARTEHTVCCNPQSIAS